MTLAISVPQHGDSADDFAQEPRPRVWSRAQFHKAADLGVFEAIERLELVDGEVLAHMTPVGSQHSAAVSMATYELTAIFGREYIVRFENPLIVSDDTELQPDVCVVAFRDDHYAETHPHASEALLVIEVSDTTLAYDRGRKAAIYAEVGVLEYWIVNLSSSRVEVYRDPEAGFGYRTVTMYGRQDSVSPLCLNDRHLSVSAILPALRTAPGA